MEPQVIHKGTFVNKRFNVNSVEEFNSELAELGINDNSVVAIRGEIWAINREPVRSITDSNSDRSLYAVVLRPVRQPRKQNSRRRPLLKLCRRNALILHTIATICRLFPVRFWLQPSPHICSEAQQDGLRRLTRLLKKGHRVRVMYISTWLTSFLTYRPESPEALKWYRHQREFVSAILDLQDSFRSLRIVDC